MLQIKISLILKNFSPQSLGRDMFIKAFLAFLLFQKSLIKNFCFFKSF